MKIARALLAATLAFGCADIVGVRQIPGTNDAGDSGAPACAAPATVMTVDDGRLVDKIFVANGFLYGEIRGTGIVRCAVGAPCTDPPNLVSVQDDVVFERADVASSILYSLQPVTAPSGSLHLTALDGTSDQSLFDAPAAAEPDLVAFAGTRELWVDDSTGAVHCIGCGASDTVWIDGVTPVAMVADASTVYVLTTGATIKVVGCDFSAPCASAPTTKLDDLPLDIVEAQLASDASNVYVAVPNASIVAIDSQGAERTVAPESAQAIAVDAATGDLFYARMDGTLARVKTTGQGAPVTLGSCALGAEVSSLAFDATKVYALVQSASGSVVFATPR